ncbi:nucleotide sugar dehydrogenase [Chryseobacterium lacus]|uniref:nucleotide sugar dehydrogenase n=1 Tax=Chryseobacterium lacus TaxID=2058346 RepID=UPI000F867F41|nr:nucleotide sugar dehydrogenase [Chryseobacterium lacus]RST26700.1 nucleotide sugar dehydrogenase [Chryseobacterium lacus]
MTHQIAIIGLGYVGLPLARLMATKFPVVGFDIDQSRIDELNSGTDSTFEVEDDILKAVLVSENPFTEQSPTQQVSDSSVNPSKGLYCSADTNDIRNANIYIVTVPTPVDKNNRPDLTPLYKASETVGKVLKKGDIVIYESTVYPGVTEEECVPVLEKVSGLTFNEDFFCGYSPERINPGDKEKTVEKILKVTSGSTPEIGRIVDDLYKSVITAGTHLAPTIKIAEASKVIENAQRDINIAFVNELAKIFSLMDIDTHEVLKAAGTKWNFLPFKPGLVGGHCIGVDPFYLAQKAQEIGYYSELILAARRLNDSMGPFVASQVIKLMIKKGIQINGAEVLMLGITFKENCHDVRNSRIVDVVRSLGEYGVQITIFDPWANPDHVFSEYGLEAHQDITNLKSTEYRFDGIVVGVGHTDFIGMELEPWRKDKSIIYDVKGIFENIGNSRL